MDEPSHDQLKIINTVHNEDGTTTLSFEIDEDFVAWFNREHSLESFCNEKFSEFIKNLISNPEKNIIKN